MTVVVCSPLKLVNDTLTYIIANGKRERKLKKRGEEERNKVMERMKERNKERKS